MNLERRILAMWEFEGWIPTNDDVNFSGSASYRRHNPLNLRRSPFAVRKENEFCVFRTDMDGLAAAKWDIIQKASGNSITGLSGKSTLRQFLASWAPASDGNNESAYLKHVLTRTGFSETMTLNELLAR
jgi:hypothetical protein